MSVSNDPNKTSGKAFNVEIYVRGRECGRTRIAGVPLMAC